jgi:Carboxylesterase family
MHAFLVAVLLSVVVVDAQGFTVGQTVKTTTGDITGQPSSWKPGVSEYLGIPFAEAPVGKLRWAAPVVIKTPGKTINATKYVSHHIIFIECFLFGHSNVQSRDRKRCY